jgi:hypothetical protein
MALGDPKMTARILIILTVGVVACDVRTARTNSSTPVGAKDTVATPDAIVWHDSLPSIGVARAMIRGVTLGMSRAEVRARLLQPDSIGRPVYEEIIADTVTSWYYPKFRIDFHGAAVGEAECSASACVTPDSVSVGAPERRVVDVYGVPGRGYPQDQRIMRYLIERQDCWLDFDIVNAKVGRIRLTCDYS